MTTLREHLSQLGAKGGKARAKKMTAKERSESARKAVEARWEKERKQMAEIVDRAKDLERRAIEAARRDGR
jgi:hypothetical protein